MTLALDFDSDDEETITEALTVLHSILESILLKNELRG